MAAISLNAKKHCASASRRIVAELKIFASQIRRRQKSYREQLYRGMAAVARTKIALEKNRDLQSAVLRRIAAVKGESDRRPSNDLTLELMVLATGANSRGSRKLASKRARVVEFLLDEGVAPSSVAEEIRRRKGIEAISRDRFRRASTQSGIALQCSSANPELASSAQPQRRANDSDVLLAVLIAASERDHLLERCPAGAKVKLFGLRVGSGAKDIKIRKAKFVNPAGLDEDPDIDEW